MLKPAYYIRIQECEYCNTFLFDSCDMLDFNIEFLCGYSFPIQLVSFLDPRLYIHVTVKQIRLNCLKTVLTFLICKYSCQANKHVGTSIQILDVNIFQLLKTILAICPTTIYIKRWYNNCLIDNIFDLYV